MNRFAFFVLIMTAILSGEALSATDLLRFGLNGKVKNLVYRDTSFSFSEAGTLISDLGKDTANVQFNSKHQPIFLRKGKREIYYKYNYDGTLVKKTLCTAGSKKCESKEFEYDVEGRLITESRCLSLSDDYSCPEYVKYVYDAQGRLAGSQKFDSVGTAKSRVSYEYESNGSLHGELELAEAGGQEIPVRYCEFENDAAGNWTVRKCTENHKKTVTRRRIVYFESPAASSSPDSSDRKGDEDSAIKKNPPDSASAPQATFTAVRGTFPYTAGIVHGSIPLEEGVRVDLEARVSGLYGKVRRVTRRETVEYAGSSAVASLSQSVFDENGNQVSFLSLDSVGDTLASVSFDKTAKGFDYAISRLGSAAEKGNLDIDLDPQGDWSAVGSVPIIHRYDKALRMVRRNNLRFEYNADGNVERVWYSDILFDFFFFDDLNKVAKVLRYDCGSGKCAVTERVSVQTDSLGNAVQEKRTYADGSAPVTIDTRIEYFK